MGIMFGLTEITEASQSPQVIEAIIPTVALPFLLVGTIVSSLVTAVAAWFGVKIQWNGPRALLRFLLKPKILISAIVLNAAIFGAVAGYRWVNHRSRPLALINLKNFFLVSPSDRVYPNRWNENQISISNVISVSGELPAPRLTIAWTKMLPSGTFRGLAFSGESAFAAALDGYIYEIDRSSGNLRRRFYVGHPSIPLPLIHDNTLFVGEGEHETHHARVYAFDLKTGLLRGHIQTKGHTEGDMTIESVNGRKILFIPTGSDGLYAVDPSTLKVIWQTPMVHFDSGVSVAGNTVFATTGTEKGDSKISPALYALDASTGKILWQTDLAASGWSRAVFYGSNVCVGVGDIYSKRNYGQFACYDRHTGVSTWSLNLEAPIFGRPLMSSVQEGSVTVVDFKGTVCRIDLKNEKLVWCHKTESSAPVFVTVNQDSSGRLFIPTSVGIDVLSGSDGRLLGRWKPETSKEKWRHTFAGISIETDGIYSIDEFGTLRKFALQ